MTGTSGPRTGRARVLIVDDEPALGEVPSVAVTEAARRPYPALDGRSGLRTARGCAPHAVVPDGMPPALDGLQVPRRLRFDNPKPPVRTLTAPDAPAHRLDAPETGADASVHVRGDLVTIEDTREVRHAGGSVRLTAGEYDLLAHPRQILRKARIPEHLRCGFFGVLGYAVRAAEEGR
ncbi:MULTISPECIES: response regulator transcription factor [Streptomyces]|uniref:Two-component system response regulator n=1 Tax=Streptomyces sviceus (strain ATCC 29083 / DSM 924 / JCM 4929 / NBRC 13980 / NCIMB 11184 / NRRL 5439 / UC 5370) TaxID=463191 RepID=B5HTC5_STRX2|nr:MULTISPECIES: response regulator transcription factor [Streptomyces]EDY56080.1 two-component system response regulator [Streptomyces sviceus ATCC 29083]MYT09049.1 DNA-binding response regulator [Streptomyces sp. SID5470]